ncbi:Protein ABHD1 [Seminavis robusta]|uniref:Protein ABHD1 n=1 Tax=Seminavis robusta TaxID=568900 RepID=A0A9N8E1A9_9STRA|nr:Protein ABHD1 [Seminavis robusta]|eukprot:Sro519_g159020.1 Protein ABHD1 (750) ;mRNA; f:39416-41765
MWSLGEYCKTQLLRQRLEDWSQLPASSRTFLQSLQLPTIHPFCEATKLDEFQVNGIPPMGPMLKEDYHHHMGDVIVTHIYRVLPALMAMGELWLRLFASVIAPLGIAYLIYCEILLVLRGTNSNSNNKAVGTSTKLFSVTILLTVASSVVLLTDTLYILEFGPHYGLVIFVISAVLATRTCKRRQLRWTLQGLLLLKLWTFFLIYDPFVGKISFGDRVEAVQNVTEGLYYHPQNQFIQHLVDAWPVEKRTYSLQLGATVWMPTGDSRTGFPFLLNKDLSPPAYRRLWLETHDHEYVALDIALPEKGHSDKKPLYMVLHGLNGGSNEDYVKEFAHRRIAEGSTVVIMVARGLMDLPVKGWDVFHGARVDDVHMTAKFLQSFTVPKQQTLAAVGYSMGAIILSNYVARSGNDCALDVAVAISGGLDMRFEHHFYRAQRLWHPMLAQKLRDTFLVQKWGERFRARLSSEDLKQSMRAYHVTEIDQHAVAPYNGFDNVTHYYSEMSAMGDIPLGAYQNEASLPEHARIHNVAIPLCVVHALDDPLSTWRTVGANNGLMHPSTLTSQIRSGNLLVLLTKAGGHVGWPLGWLPWIRKWEWMNNAASTFVEAVHQVSQQHTNNRQCVNSGGGKCSSGAGIDTEEDADAATTDEAPSCCDTEETVTVADAEEATTNSLPSVDEIESTDSDTQNEEGQRIHETKETSDDGSSEVGTTDQVHVDEPPLGATEQVEADDQEGLKEEPLSEPVETVESNAH